MTAPERPVRVRFAPSPTGWLHVGGARTAYFNWLFARQHKGAFLLRVEDTDLERSSADSEAGVLADLAWLGLTWDEGPDVGGPHGPYRQSERLALYRQRADALLASDAAYRCFCTDDALEQRRQAAIADGRPPHYDGTCRAIAPDTATARAAAGESHTVRFKVPSRAVHLHDHVRGDVEFPPDMVGDFVVLRSNGLPTYNFACAVDDADMRISHVLRAEEHLANTPRQLLIHEALGATPPEFAHVSLILNTDRTKMSKRAGEAAVAVGDWRRAGYTADALLAYLALLGFHPGDERELLSRDEMLEAFTLERLGKSGAVFDAARLRWTNAHLLHLASGAQLHAWAEQGATAGESFVPEPARAWPAESLITMLEAVRGDLTTLADLPTAFAPYLGGAPTLEPDAATALAAPSAAVVLAAAARELSELAEWSAAGVQSAVRAAGVRANVKGRELFQPVRAALTGRTHGPELALVALLLGRERSLERLTSAAQHPHREDA